MYYLLLSSRYYISVVSPVVVLEGGEWLTHMSLVSE
jgi:hypothetical protein